jgi:hypothetical protein
MAKIGDTVETPQGKGRVVRGSTYDKPPAHGGHWVFLFYPADLNNRVICYHRSQVKLVKG